MADTHSAAMLAYAQGINQNLAALVKSFGAVAQNLASPGYMKFSNGMIINWGTGSTASGTGSITYNLPFPNACMAVFLTVSGTAAATDNALIASSTPGKASCNVYGAAAQSLSFYYFAIGY